MISIEPELPTHRDAIRKVTETAFAASEFGHNGEADLVDSLRDANEQTISLVALKDEVVVGHIMFSPVVIRRGDAGEVQGMGLAPLAVLPAYQRTGIGMQLVKEGLHRLARMTTTFVVVAGDTGYYARFGFEPAAKYEITHGFAGMPQSIFQICFPDPQDRERMRAIRGGLAFYLPEFGPQHEHSI